MTQPLRIENSKRVGLITSKTQNSRLWFVNNNPLEKQILGALAMYQEKHNASLYAFALMGNHDHLNAAFPEANRASFMRDFNAQTARLTKRLVPEVGRGKFWEKRYSEQELARNEDIEEYFFYCALQAVSTELADHPDKYNQYNSFQDAISGVEREYLVTNWTKYNNARRWNPKVAITRYQTSYKLKYTRLPGYEHLEQREYKELMCKKFEYRRMGLIAEHLKAGKIYPTSEELSRIHPGAYPNSSKQGNRDPLVLCSCPTVLRERLDQYYATKNRHSVCSARYLAGDLTVVFPTGTYRPPMLCQREEGSITSGADAERERLPTEQSG